MKKGLLVLAGGIVVALVFMYAYTQNIFETSYDRCIRQLESMGCRIDENPLVADWDKFNGIFRNREDVTHEEVSWGEFKTRAVLIYQKLGYCVVLGDRDAGVLWITSIGDDHLREEKLFPELRENYYFYYFVP